MSSDAFRPLLAKVASGTALTGAEASTAFGIILRGEASEVQVASFVSFLHLRGETPEEIAAAAQVLRDNMVRVDAPAGAIDMVGTGGDGVGTLNISTAAAIVVAACGVKVAKHGNRALSSKSGAADVLAALGVRLSLPPGQISRCIAQAGIGFMFAPDHHAALAHVGPVRRQLGFRTVFNLLGPLCNPASVDRQLAGVFAERWLVPYAEVLRLLGSKRAWVVHGEDGLDEISISGPTQVAELNAGSIRRMVVTPEDAGLRRHALGEVLGGDAQANAAAMRRLLDGATGAYHDIVCLNAAAGLVVAEAVTSLRAGVERAAQAIASGAARGVLDTLVKSSMPENVLATIAVYKADEIRQARARVGDAEIAARARKAPPVRPFKASLLRAIAAGTPALIAEIKKASPSKGLIRPDFDPPALAKAYEQGGAACLSVLTDRPSFQGDDAYLVAARAATQLPVLRKDFLFEPYQVVEARALGADCILIIMAAVTDEQARALQAAARDWGMDALFEVHNDEEMSRALALDPQMVGINNRDLMKFVTDLGTTERLAPRVPAGKLVVSESGINTHADLLRLAGEGVKAFLVGESLMRQADVAAATRRLLQGGS
jgi:anthranilate phosphoribosyltransferase